MGAANLYTSQRARESSQHVNGHFCPRGLLSAQVERCWHYWIPGEFPRFAKSRARIGAAQGASGAAGSEVMHTPGTHPKPTSGSKQVRPGPEGVLLDH